MPLCINQKCIFNHLRFSRVCETSHWCKGGGWIYLQLTFIRFHCLPFEGKLCLLVGAEFIVNPFVLPEKPSGQVWRWRTGSQHSWREDWGGWEILLTWPPHARWERRGTGERGRTAGGGWTPEGFGHPSSRGAEHSITFLSAVQHSHRVSRLEKYPQVAKHPSLVIPKLVEFTQEPKKEDKNELFLPVWDERDELWRLSVKLRQNVTERMADARAKSLLPPLCCCCRYCCCCIHSGWQTQMKLTLACWEEKFP